MKGKASNSSSPKKRVLIVDDHPMMRDGLRQLIAYEADIEVCAEADTIPEALNAADKHKPDLAIVDISLKGGNGLELIKDLQIRHPEVSVIVISMHDESLYAERVLRAGGRGYIMKQEGGKRIIEGIRQVISGRTFVSDAVSARIIDAFSGHGKSGQPSVELLTDREFEIFQLIGQGLTTKVMAEKLHVSVKTVEVHRVNIKEKLNLPTATDLIRFAVRWVESR
ncbi:MAG: response regulator transcription factor [Verrucomicrobiota bacterium]|nr:response regulator transcription factor [Verrucomicrobiota bacterium]